MQKIAAISSCWMMVFSPLVTHAAALDYPALGVRLNDLPAGAKSLGVGENLRGYHVQILFDTATTSATISRFDEAVPQGNVADEAYRKALFEQFDIHSENGSVKLVTIAGQPAWMSGSAQRFGPMARYACDFYLVVGDHLYDIAVSAIGKVKPAAANFNAAAVAIVSSLAFEPVQQQPDKPLAPGELPPFLMGNQTEPFYSDRARRIGESGVVMLKFNIDGGGVARDMTVAGHANADLAESAVSMIESGRFKVPQEWEQSGGAKQTFTMEFRFELSCPPAHPLPEVVPDSQVETICGSTLER
ncbi:MAG TPA: energy transducer TonB [Steroidobacteraceae bacterium]